MRNYESNGNSRMKKHISIKNSINVLKGRLYTAEERISWLENTLEENIQKGDLKDKKLKFWKTVEEKTVRNSNMHEIGISEEKESENESKSITKSYREKD